MPDKMFKNPKRAYSIPEICEASGVGRSTVYGALASGKLAASKVGRRTIVTSESFDSWIASLPRANFVKSGEAA